jgi:acetylornithine/succinyldiaminopimelate/putrescine aminotransferase/predicted amino acid dehydrogenase
MKFAFLVHPLSEDSKALVELNDEGTLSNNWGGDLLQFCNFLQTTMAARREAASRGEDPRVRVIDRFSNLRSATGAVAEGRLYEIPMGAAEILDDPGRAIEYMQQATAMAAEWGAGIVGLGSMTGIVGGGGTYLAEHSTVPVTTGNSLTIYVAIQNLYHACQEANIDLSRETVAVVGIPGSIAAAAAQMLAPMCGDVLLVGRRESSKATQLSKKLGAELLLDVPAALRRARVVFSATSSGNCIDQRALRPGSVVVDVGVPADVQGSRPIRRDVLIISGGLSLVPDSFPRDSMFLSFHHGMIPSCLGETINLALENRPESFSLGRNLSVEGVQEIGAIAAKNGFRFDRLYSFGLALDASQLSEYHKAVTRRMTSVSTADAIEEMPTHHANGNGHHANGKRMAKQTAGAEVSEIPSPQELSRRAAKLYERYINPVLLAIGGNNGFTKTFIRGSGNYLWDADESRYLDFVAGFGSANLGHNHPRIVEELTRAMKNEAPGFAQSAVNPLAARLAEELVAITPDGLEMVFFSNSGTEAVEAALKLARLSTGRAGLLHCDRSYHGKSLGSLSVTGNPNYQKPFGPLLADCGSVPFGDLPSLERELSTKKYACFIVEPIQAEAGIYVPPRDYLPEAERLCRKYGTLLVVDEVQTGMGRTGTMFAVDALGVRPDIMTLAKSLGGGLVPIGATIARRDLWLKAYGSVDRFALHTSTFGGGSLACTAGLATLRVIREENLLERCRARSARLMGGLRSLLERFKNDPLDDVRGEGLLIGLQFSPLLPSIAAHYKASDQTGMLKFIMRDMEGMIDTVPTLYALQSLLNAHGVYAQVARSNPFVLRIQPPLTIEEADVDHLLGALEKIAPDLADCASMVDTIVSRSTLGIHESADKNTLPDEFQRPLAAHLTAARPTT